MILDHLAEITTEARAHYQVWWAIAHHGPTSYQRALNGFPDFFEATRVAHFRCMLLAAWKPFDRNSKVASFHKLLSDKTIALESSDRERIEKHIVNKPKLKSLEKIRHLYVSHRNAAISSDEIFKMAGINPDELLEIIEESANIVREIQRNMGKNSVVFESNRGLKSTLHLFEALEKNA